MPAPRRGERAPPRGTVAEPRSSIRADEDGHRWTQVFPRELTAVADARRWVEHALDEGGAAERSDDAQLVISELVTNALRHGLGEVVARVQLTATEVQLSVTDAGQTLPELRPQRPGRIGGMGLFIVARLAADWGVAPFPGGKTVWAVLARS